MKRDKLQMRPKPSFYFILLVLIFFYAIPSHSEEKRESQILDWDESEKAFVHKNITLQDLGLKSSTHYILEHFSIHSGLEPLPVPLEKVEENLKLMTLGYHLQKIENRFRYISKKASFKKDITAFNPPIRIRIDAPYAYSPTDYYDKNTSLKNTALTIPPSDSKNGWNSELWFAPKWSFPVIGGTFAVDRIIDTALCPDAIYHEYAHLITGKYLGNNSIGKSLSEGLSDYYTASMLNHPELYTYKTCEGVKRQLLVTSFRLDKSFGSYDTGIESEFKKDLRFIPSLLWQYRNVVGKDLADVTILQAVSGTGASPRFFPEFLEAISSALYQEVKKSEGERAALELVDKVETSVFLPHKVFTKRSRKETIFGLLPKTSILLPNSDSKTNVMCQNRNEYEFFWDTVGSEDPNLRFYWHCDQVKIPMVIDFEQSDPGFYLLKNNVAYLSGKLRFASKNPDKADSKLSEEDRMQYLNLYDYVKNNYLFYRTMDKEVRLYYGEKGKLTEGGFRLGFAYPGILGGNFTYRFTGN
ncbi:hypothetical protein LPTSP3_g08140 [Leptospira kobayashii]|uniref:Peptidase MA family protein n=1 Tax=Leptospira kobayashii TaxID=1917830 RepID=A0ABN6KAC7_9LEPT|nr:hypothetical protein [Leptospira kobayashii]BDA77884.1 hypothetical protein LPTSP3_g08140 [Leptospira kobayashii]